MKGVIIMRIGTTPTFTFHLPFSSSLISKIRVIFHQNNKIVLKKNKSDLEIDGEKFNLTLKEHETFMFEPGANVTIQAHILTTENQALTSNEYVVSAIRCLDDGVITT